MTETPRTDAFEAAFSVDSEKTLADCYDDAIEFARGLERELSAANGAIMMMVEDVNKIVLNKENKLYSAADRLYDEEFA